MQTLLLICLGLEALLLQNVRVSQELFPACSSSTEHSPPSQWFSLVLR